MPKDIQTPATSQSIFFTVALINRGDDLLLREIERLRQAVRITRAQRPFVIEAWVVLPDHLHAIWTLPPGDHDYATRWRLIKTRFSLALTKRPLDTNDNAGCKRAIWQPGVSPHRVTGPDDHAAHLRFCRTDPVKHGLVDDPGDWPYSSFSKPRQLNGAESIA